MISSSQSATSYIQNIWCHSAFANVVTNTYLWVPPWPRLPFGRAKSGYEICAIIIRAHHIIIRAHHVIIRAHHVIFVLVSAWKKWDPRGEVYDNITISFGKTFIIDLMYQYRVLKSCYNEEAMWMVVLYLHVFSEYFRTEAKSAPIPHKVT